MKTFCHEILSDRPIRDPSHTLVTDTHKTHRDSGDETDKSEARLWRFCHILRQKVVDVTKQEALLHFVKLCDNISIKFPLSRAHFSVTKKCNRPFCHQRELLSKVRGRMNNCQIVTVLSFFLCLLSTARSNKTPRNGPGPIWLPV